MKLHVGLKYFYSSNYKKLNCPDKILEINGDAIKIQYTLLDGDKAIRLDTTTLDRDSILHRIEHFGVPKQWEISYK